VIAGFGRHFVKAGRLERKFHRYLRDVFQDRQRADYAASEVISQETARTTLDRAREFLDAAHKFLSRPGTT
jgi:uncharacterized protein (UPF0332 family)